MSQSNSVAWDAGVMPQDGMSDATDLRTLLDNYERELILAALQASGGHQRRAAAVLGVLPTTLHEKMKRLGLLRPKPAGD
jgi:DNA-binding NtrC family response regulator